MATRPGDWGALGLDGDPTPGDAAAITAIADAMRDLATNAGTINNGLKALQQTAGDGRRFVGKTADQLRDMVDDHLHNFVGHVEESFHQAEAALRTYATAVTDAQSDADQALSAIQGLADDDPQRQTHIDRADEARTALSNAASTLDKALTAAGSLMVQPVSDCDMFWEAFEWLTIVLSVIAIFTGGVLAVLAWGMNAVLLIKTIVDFSQGKASGLELGLAFLGVLFPTTKALPVGSIVKGLGGVLKGGFEGVAGAGKNIFAEIGHFSSLHGMPKIVVAPAVIAAHAAPALNIVNGVKGLGNLAKGGWESLAGTFAKDWATVTGHLDGGWAKIGAYAKVNFGRGGRIVTATVLPLDFTELGVLGFGGAARLAFGERVLGIKQPELHALLANAGRTDAALRGGIPTGAFGGPGALVPFRPVGGTGAPFVPGGFVNLSSLHLGAAGLPGGFPGALTGAHFTPGGLGAFTPGGLGAFTPNGLGAFTPGGLGALTPNGLGALTPNGLGAFMPNGLGGIAPNGITVPHGVTAPQGVTAPHGMTVPQGITVPNGSLTHAGVQQIDQPGLVTAPDVPGMTTHANGLTVPDVHGSGATQLIQQTDFAAGHIRMDNNLLLSADTAIDLLKDTHASSPLAHADAPAVRVPEASFDAGSVHGIGDGHAMARGAAGHGEALEDMTFPELQALASGDVAVTAFHGDGVSIRIGDAATRTFTAQDLAHTVPGGPARTDLTGIQDAALTHGSAGTRNLPGADGVPGAHGGPAATIRPTGAGAHDPLRAKSPDAAAGTNAGASSGNGSLTETAPQPVPDQHDLAMSLLDAGDRKPAPATGHSATGHSATSDSGPAGVSARPDLDGAGASGIADHSALDLIAHPGDEVSKVDVSKAADAAAVPAAVKAAEHAPTPTPAPAPKAGPAPTPASGLKDSGPVTAPPRNRFGGFSGAAAMNQRLRARNDLILGGSTGPEAGAKLNAWAGYENALSQLGKAERKVAELAPPPGAAQGEPSPALAEALDDLGVKRAEAAEAEARLDELGIDAARTRKQINALTGGLFGEHGFAGGPRPHPQPETQAVPPASVPSASVPSASVPSADKGKAADHVAPEPAPSVDKGKGKADSVAPQPAPGSPFPHRPAPEDPLGSGPGTGRGARDQARHDIVTGGTSGAEAELRLDAWEQYQRASYDLAGAQGKVDRLVPKADQPGPSKPSPAAFDALDDLGTKRAEFAEAETRLGELGMDPQAIRQQLDDANNAIAVERAQNGEYVGPLGGAPTPHSDEPLPLGAHDWSPDPQAPHALWPEPGTHGAGRTMVNQSFRDLPYVGHQPLTADDYLSWMRASTGEGRPLSFVVNTIAPYHQIAGGLQDFLNSITRGLDGYDGRLGVVIGVNGKAEDLPAIHRAMDQALESVAFDHPLALVATTFYGEKFPYGTIRNHTMTSPAARSMAHSMMHGGPSGPSHPYWAFMDFDVYEHTVPSGRHVFDHFDREFTLGEGGAVDDWAKNLPDDTGAAAKASDDSVALPGDTDPKPLRPLGMVGGYRVPAKTGETVELDGVQVDSSVERLIKETKNRDATPAGMTFTQQDVDKFASVVDADMRIRAMLAGIHGLLPYGPEPNLFVDAAVTMVDKVRLADGSAWQPIRFGGGSGEYKGLREKLNHFHAWELDQTLPDTPGNAVARDIAAANSTLPDRGTAFVADFVGGAVPTDLSRLMAGYYKLGKAGGVGNMPQEHLTLKNVVEHAFGRDSFDVDPNTVPAKDGLKLAKLREDLLKGKSPHLGFRDDPLKPLGIDGRPPEFNEHPRATLDRLGAGLGGDGNTLGLNISLRVPGRPDGLVVGIVPAEKRFISHALAFAAEEATFTRLQNYVIAEVLPTGGLPYDSLLRSLPEPPAGANGPRGARPAPGAIPDAQSLLTQLQRQMGKNGVADLINDAYTRGIDGRALTVGLVTGRLGPDVSEVGPIQQIMLERYAKAFNRPLEIRGTEGSTHTVDVVGARKPGPPLYLTWVPDHGGPQPGHWDVSDQAPAPQVDKGKGVDKGPSIDKGKGRATDTDVPGTDVPRTGGSGTNVPGTGGSVTPAPPPKPLGFEPGTGIGERAAARHDIVTGGTSGPEAELRLDAWAQYERAANNLARAQDDVHRLVPDPHGPGPAKPSAASLDALGELGARRADMDRAEARLDELGMDPQALRQQIDDANSAIAADRAQRGEYVGPLGGAPSSHPGPRDVEMTDAQPGPSGQGGGNHQMPGLRWDGALTRGTTPGDIRANTAFQNLHGLDQRPLSGADYLANVRDSVREQRPLSFVVNTVVKYDDLGNGQLDAFLRAVTTGLPDSFRGRFGVIIGLNGPASEMARINTAVRHALDGVQEDFPIAVVGVGWRGADFPYGIVRNTVMTSPASRSMVHAMMAGGADGTGRTHPYFAFMDFDDFPHTVPSGRHIFDYFEKKFDIRGVERAGEPSSAEPLRPLAMFGGYRVPEPPGDGSPDPLLVKIDDHLAKGEAKGKVKPSDTTRQPGELRVTQENRITVVLRVRADTHARVGIARRHPLLPYAPEPNLFVDATATLVDAMPGVQGWLPLRFGLGGAEYHQLSRALNNFNAWELDTTLPRLTEDDFPRLPGESQDDWEKRVADGITDREAQRQIAAGNHTLPVRGTAFVAEFEKAAISTDLSRVAADLFSKSGKLLQDHAGLAQVERLVVDKDTKRGLELKPVRDERFHLSPEAADHDNPLRPVYNPTKPFEGPAQEPPRVIAARLSDQLGTDAHALGLNVSAGLPGDPSIRAGIRQEDLRFITHGYAHNEEPSYFLDMLDHAIVHASHQPAPTSVLHAFENAPGHLRLPSAEQLLRDVRAQLGRGGTVSKNAIKNLLNEVLRSNLDTGLTTQELSIALAGGRLRRNNFLPDGLEGAADRAVRATAEDFALQRYANALGRELHITFADGSMTTFAPEKAGKKRLPPPVEIVWTTSTDTVRYPDGGHWTVADNEPGPVAGGKRGRGGADGAGGDTHPKRPRKGKGRADGPADPDTPMGGIQ
ncbi:putative T7SS-secreted protein [Streptomyces sclerotialus]|uniref:putative T7SS-secreted protein n=1 Tax=Streptomyces sclerotialus TaxID=1957 RepID=UPI0004CA4E14